MVPKKILISDPRVLAVSIHENNEPLVDLVKEYPEVFANRIVASWQSKEPSPRLVRQTVASKLVEASKLLPKGIKLYIIEGYRSLNEQQRIFAQQMESLKQKHPDFDHEKLKKMVSRFVSPPDIVPPHSTGGAVDLNLFDCSDNHRLDFGTKFLNDVDVKYGNSNATNYKNLSPEALKNRQLLIEVMNHVGMVNYPFEWWHWSYGDRYWAYQTKQGIAIYGSVNETA